MAWHIAHAPARESSIHVHYGCKNNATESIKTDYSEFLADHCDNQGTVQPECLPHEALDKRVNINRCKKSKRRDIIL